MSTTTSTHVWADDEVDPGAVQHQTDHIPSHPHEDVIRNLSKIKLQTYYQIKISWPQSNHLSPSAFMTHAKRMQRALTGSCCDAGIFVFDPPT